MAQKIPTSQPQAIAGAGSVGTQSDINLGSNVFDAIRGAGRTFDKLKGQAQASIDRTSTHRAAKANRTLSQTIDAALADPEISTEPDKWGEVVNSTIEESNDDFEELLKGVTGDQADLMRIDRESAIMATRSSIQLKAADQIQDNENAAALANAENLASSGDLKGANSAIDSMVIQKDEKIGLKKRAKSIHDTLIKNIQREAEIVASEGFKIQTREADTIADAEALEIPSSSPKEMARMKTAKASRVSKLTVDANRRTGDYAKDILLTGKVPDEMSRDRDQKDSVVSLFESFEEDMSGDFGEASLEFTTLLGEANEVEGLIRATGSTSRGPFGIFGLNKKGRSIRDTKLKLSDAISGNKFEGVARARLLNALANLDSLDAQDGNIFAGNNIKDLEESETTVYSLLQNTISNLTKGPDGKVDDLKDIGMDPDKITEVYNQVNKMISDKVFKDKSTAEVSAIWEETIVPFVNQKVQESSVRSLQRALDL